jgi:hypothetical protein
VLRRPLETIKTRKWGEVKYPKGTHPLVVEAKVGDAQVVMKEGLGYRKDQELALIRKALEAKFEKELDVSQKADVTVSFPQSKKAPVKFFVAGEQPMLPKVIHHPSWPPPEEVVADIKEEFRKNPNRKTASDLEAMAYLNTASMAGPMSEKWCRIYFYLTRKYLMKKGWKKFKGGMEFMDGYKTLRPGDERELKHLKEWIFEEQKKELAERRRVF